MFALHPQLRADCFPVGRFVLCQLLLLNDARYPWFILVPQRAGVSEIYMLDEADRAQLWQESDALSRYMAELFQPDKLNIAALGNVVPQLHIHHIARFRSDPAWPRPVWGFGESAAYGARERDELIARVSGRLCQEDGFEAEN